LKGNAKIMPNRKLSPYENYQIEVKDNKLIIIVDLDESNVALKESNSGQSMVVSTTGGAVVVPQTRYKLNLNLYYPAG